jgi:TonB family protein
MLRRHLPYLGFSLAAHALLLLLLLYWRLPLEPEAPPKKVLLEFRRPASAESPAARLAARSPRELPGLGLPEGGRGRLAMPAAAAPPDLSSKRTGVARAQLPPAKLPRAELPRRTQDSPARAAEPTGAAALPTARQLLRGFGGAAPAPAEATGERGSIPGPSGYMQATALEWKGGERTQLQQPQVRFPALLLEKGLEVDVEADFVVAPSGQVASVEITRSSGFASVDRAVEQALRDALFSEAAQEDSGRIRFRFRLERKQ